MQQAFNALAPEDERLAWFDAPAVAFGNWIASVEIAPGRGYRGASIAVYSSMWAKFCGFAGQRGVRPAQVSDDLLKEFFQRLFGRRGRQASSSSRQRYAMLLASVFRHLQEIAVRPDNPTEGLPFELRGPTTRPLPVFLTQTERARLLARLLRPARPRDWKGARDRALLLLILGSGLRVSEVRAIEVHDLRLEPDGASICVPPCGARTSARIVPIADFARPALDQWLELRDILRPSGHILFPANACGDQLCPSTIYLRAAASIKAAGIQRRHVGPHVLRHTFAAHQLAEGTPLPEVSDLLGHVLESSTEVYRKVVPQKARSAQT